MAGLRFLPRGALVNPKTGVALPIWERYLRDLQPAILSLGTVDREDVGGAIAATPVVVIGTLTGGLYRLSYWARITRAATVSSELTVTFAFTDGNVAQSESGALINGNLTTTHQTGQLTVAADKNTSITYATTYASVGATTMQYKLQIEFEQLV